MLKFSENLFLWKYSGAIIWVIFIVLVFAGCERKEPIPAEVLRNGEYYFSCLDKMVRLTDGEYSEMVEVEGRYGKRLVNLSLFLEGYATGDLNGDGLKDVAAILTAQCSGSGAFVNLEVLINSGREFKYRAMKLLGDRVDVRSIGIEDRKIVVDMLTHDKDDPLCCPTLRVKRRFLYKEGEK